MSNFQLSSQYNNIRRQTNTNLSVFAIECLELSRQYRNNKEIIKLSGIACGFGILLLIGAVTTYIVLRKRRNRQIGLGIIIEFHYILSNNNHRNDFSIIYAYVENAGKK